MAPQYTVPEGETFFSDLKTSFKDVKIGDGPDHKIPTMPFLDAYESKAFSTVYGDIKGNIDVRRIHFSCFYPNLKLIVV